MNPENTVMALILAIQELDRDEDVRMTVKAQQLNNGTRVGRAKAILIDSLNLRREIWAQTLIADMVGDEPSLRRLADQKIRNESHIAETMRILGDLGVVVVPSKRFSDFVTACGGGLG